MSTLYYAISGVGYGTGGTVEEAVDSHRRYALAARPSWIARSEWRARLTEDDTQPTVFRSPEHADGFTFHGATVAWTRAGGFIRYADEHDVITTDERKQE